MTAAVLPALLASAAVVLAGAGSVRALAGRSVPSPVGTVGRHRGDPRAGGVRAAALLTIVVVIAGAFVVVGPVPSLVVVASAGLVRAELVRRARHRDRRASDAAFPDLVDLFRIAAAAGHPVHRCLEVVAPRAPASVRGPLEGAVTAVRRGVALADALDALGPALGTSGSVLTDALRAAARTGSPLGPVLDRVVLVARDRRARSAQQAARRLPVTLLFPLVCCVLPAFGLLGVVPLLAGSLSSLAP